MKRILLGLTFFVVAQAPCLAEPNTFELMNQRRFDEALIALNNRIKQYPQASGLYKQRGECNYQLMRYKDAVADLTRGIKLNKNPRWDYYSWRYASFIKLGQFREALADCEKVLELSPGNTRARTDLIAIAKRLPQNKHAQQIATDFPKVHPELAVQSLVDQRKFKEAEALVSPILKKPLSQEQRIFYLAHRAHSHVGLSNFPEAIADYNELIRIHPNPPITLYLSRSEIKAAAGQYRQAAADISELINKKLQFKNLRVTTDDLYFKRASYYLKASEFRKAISDYDVILKMDATQEEAYKLRGDCHAALKEYALAAADYTKAIENDAESPDSSYFARSLVYEKMGKMKEAAADRKKALELGYVPKTINKVK
ncbi:MAG: hypothetical protein C0507_06925 [Cyanobacteria bacterium PR.3.49]|nr:hypothetical protein [Cyanobacteria bacterium PR.3.49]